MNISSEQYERIMYFLDADMAVEEMEAFEKELAANPAMREQLDFEVFVRDGFALKKDLITEVNTDFEEKGSRKKQNSIHKLIAKKWYAIAIAASVITFVLIVLFYPQKGKPPEIVKHNTTDTSHIQNKDTIQLAINKPGDTIKTRNLEKLFTQYFTMDSVPESYPIFLAEALTNYENGDYTTIQQLNLTDLPEVRGEDNKQTIVELGRYYKGISFLKTGDIKKAIHNLEWVEKNSSIVILKIKTAWYLAMAHLKSGNVSSARRWLEKLTSSSTISSYKQKALKLLIHLH